MEEKKTRRRFTNSDKLAMVRHVERQLAEGMSARAACNGINIHPRQFRSWKQQRDVLVKRNPRAKSIDDGRVSILQQYEAEPPRFTFENREQGVWKMQEPRLGDQVMNLPPCRRGGGVVHPNTNCGVTPHMG